MHERHPFVLLLSCMMSADRAAEIAGDLREEARERHLFWEWCQYPALLFSFWRARTSKSPWLTLAIAAGVVCSAAVVTCFLLIPLSLVHIDVRVLPLMLVLCLLRALACFVTAAVAADKWGIIASPGIMLGALFMIGILVLRLYALEQGFWLPAANVMGAIQHGVFYVLSSALPLIAGCIYGLGCRQYRVSTAGQVT